MPDLALLALASAALPPTVTHGAHVELREEEAAALPDGSACRVRWIMRADGTYTQVEVLECPEGYEGRVAEAAARWTFAPPVAKVHFAEVHLRPPRAPAADSPSAALSPPPSPAQPVETAAPVVQRHAIQATRRAPLALTRAIEPPLSCTLLVDFDAAGLPVAVTLDRCDAELAEAAVDAAWRWRFSATDGEGQPQSGRYTVRFVVEPD